MLRYKFFFILSNSTPSFKTDFLKSEDIKSKIDDISNMLRASIAPGPSIPEVKISKRKKIFQATNPNIKGIGLKGKGA